MGSRGTGQIGRDQYSDDYKSIKEFDPKWMGPGSHKVWYGLIDSHPTNKPIEKKIRDYDQENYFITDNVGYHNVLDVDPKFLYKINSNGFRSQHFKEVDNDKITILTGGCSHSFGEGLPEELRWQSFLLNNINLNNIETFDVSSMGGSFRLIIRNVVSFIRNYGKPDYIFLALPDVARDFGFDTERKEFQSVNVNSEFLIKKDKTPTCFKKYTLSFDEHDAMMIAVEAIWFLEELCNQSGIKLFWTTWVPGLDKVFKELKIFNNYLSTDWEIFAQTSHLFEYANSSEKILKMKEEHKNANHFFIKANINEDHPFALEYIKNNNITDLKLIEYIKKYWLLANDGSHHGVFWTSEIGRMFGEKINNDTKN